MTPRPLAKAFATALLLVGLAFAVAASASMTALPRGLPAPVAVLTASATQSDYSDLVNQSREEYLRQGRTPAPFLQDYDPLGNYLNYGTALSFSPSDRVQPDPNGIPMVRYSRGDFYYNPVTISQYALHMYGRYLDSQDTEKPFLLAADLLLYLQDGDGAFRYPFPWRYYLTNEVFEPGWISGMAQGQALSVFARAYRLTGNRRYIEGGNAALSFLLKPIADGGPKGTLADLDPALASHVFFEEYIADPESYTLNGFMFTLLGLYDWSRAGSADQRAVRALADRAFREGIASLKLVLPLYDLGGFTAYDLGYITHGGEPHVGAGYHAAHVYLLHALHSVTGDAELRAYEQLWTSYVEGG